MKISVVVPVYNEEKYIENCLNSLINQSEKPDEIIVVDNNCIDKTIFLTKQYPVKIIKEKKQGMIFARNRGFNEAKHEIIARCDADTILPINWIKKIKKNFNRFPIDALTGPVTPYDLIIKTKDFAITYFEIMRFIQNGAETLVGPNMVITKKIWKKVKNKVCLNDNQVHEDIDLAIHIFKEGGKIKRDNSLIIKMSGRRIKNNPLSFFVEYPVRMVKTFQAHGIKPLGL